MTTAVLITDTRSGFAAGTTQTVSDALALLWIGQRWALLSDAVSVDPLSAQEIQSSPAATFTAADVVSVKALATGAGNNTAVVLGDSIARCQGVANNTMSFMEYAALASNGALRLLANYGVNGAKTSDVLAVQVPLAVASTARFVFVMEAANDALNSVSVTTHRTNMQAILAAIITAGKTPIVVGAPPVNSFNAWQYNAADQQLAVSMGVRYVQPWAVVASNAAWRDATYSLDGVHPYPKSSRLAGSALWAAVQPLFIGTGDLAWSDQNGWLTNCLNLTNTAGVPTGWTGASPITHTCTEAVTGEGAGNWWNQTAIALTAWQVSTRAGVALPTGWLGGDTVRMSARIRAVGFEANGGKGDTTYPTQGNMGAYLNLAWTGGVAGSMLLRECDGDVNGVASVDGVIPAGTTGGNFQNVVVQFGAVNGEWSVAQWQVHNLSLAARLP